MSVHFEVSNIVDPVIVNPMGDLESASTDFITDYFFDDPKKRANFYWIIQKLFETYRDKIFTGDMEQYRDHIYMIFKGGNIIKAVIDKTEDNIRKAIERYDDINNNDDLKELYSLNDFNPTKRSDSDFTILIDYKKISKDNIILYTQVIIGCEYIAYMISDYIRNNYDKRNGTVNYESNNIPIINITNNVDKLNKLVDNMNTKFTDSINKTAEYLSIAKKNVGSTEDQYINSSKNIVMTFAKIMGEKNLFLFDEKQNFKPATYHDDITPLSRVSMPIIKGFILNDQIKYNMENITENNCVSIVVIKKLLKNADRRIDVGNVLNSNYEDLEIFFANRNSIPVIADDRALYYVSGDKNVKYNGFNIANKDVDNKYLFRNFKDPNIYYKDEIENIISKKYENKSPLYISSNRTLRFTKKNIQTAFNLIRMKHNFRIFFELANTIKKIGNTDVNIQYVYVDIPGEFIDITVPTYADFMLNQYMDNFNKYISKRYISINNNSVSNYKQSIYTYSNYGLIHDLEFILFTVTGDRPWDDNKYSKRLERLFRIYFAEIKNILKVNEKIKNQLGFISQTLALIRDKFISYKQDGNKKNIQVIQQYIDIIRIELKIIDDYININQKDNQNLFYELFNNVLNPVIKVLDNINNSTDIDNVILYLDDVIKYYKIFVENIILPISGNLYDIQLGGGY